MTSEAEVFRREENKFTAVRGSPNEMGADVSRGEATSERPGVAVHRDGPVLRLRLY